MRDTIKKHQDFLMRDDDPSARSPYFFVRAKKARFADDPRVGFTATKRTFRLAVERNRAKRLLRDWVRHNKGLMADMFDYVFIARPQILNATRTDGRDAIEKALRYIVHTYVPKENAPKKFFKKKKNVKNS